ncbi:tripartite tricarboxylate transporter TctB family protein [Tistrella bauzanensis]|uniref:Tripartite tricarboxylate transporter TctB family protein n=1 Tax=Tistrella arctica TaxID=3133430 RepID=A0ABU9YDA5_9PROT
MLRASGARLPDICLGVAMLALAGYVFIETAGYDQTAALAPRLFAAVLGLSGLLMLVPVAGRKTAVIVMRQQALPLAVAAGIGVVILAVEPLGFELPAFVLFIVIARLLGDRLSLSLVVTAALFTGAIRLIFGVLLGVPLPSITG